ncbi:MAG: SRPBCC family protein [Gammaproteobacteria bacterium]
MRSFLIGLLLIPVCTGAGEILELHVEHAAGVYGVSLDARIDAPVAHVQRLVTDYAHLSAINPSILESRVLRVIAPDTHRVHSLLRVCILIFCKEMIQVQDVRQHGGGLIEALTVPALSDFRSGVYRWQLLPEDTATRMRFSAQLEPDFWVPPVIGPWLIKRKLHEEVRVTTAAIESGAHSEIGK